MEPGGLQRTRSKSYSRNDLKSDVFDSQKIFITSRRSSSYAIPSSNPLKQIYSTKFLEAIANGSLIKTSLAPGDICQRSEVPSSAALPRVNCSDVWNHNVDLRPSTVVLHKGMSKHGKVEDSDDEDNTEEIEPPPDEVESIPSEPVEPGTLEALEAVDEPSIPDETSKPNPNLEAGNPNDVSIEPINDPEIAPLKAPGNLPVNVDTGINTNKVKRCSVKSGQSQIMSYRPDGGFETRRYSKGNLQEPIGARGLNRAPNHYEHYAGNSQWNECRIKEYCQNQTDKPFNRDNKYFRRKEEATCKDSSDDDNYAREGPPRQMRAKLYNARNLESRRYPTYRRASQSCPPPKYGGGPFQQRTAAAPPQRYKGPPGNPCRDQDYTGYYYEPPEYIDGNSKPVRYISHPDTRAWENLQDTDEQCEDSPTEENGKPSLVPGLNDKTGTVGFIGLPPGYNPGDTVAIRLYAKATDDVNRKGSIPRTVNSKTKKASIEALAPNDKPPLDVVLYRARLVGVVFTNSSTPEQLWQLDEAKSRPSLTKETSSNTDNFPPLSKQELPESDKSRGEAGSTKNTENSDPVSPEVTKSPTKTNVPNLSSKPPSKSIIDGNPGSEKGDKLVTKKSSKSRASAEKKPAVKEAKPETKLIDAKPVRKDNKVLKNVPEGSQDRITTLSKPKTQIKLKQASSQTGELDSNKKSDSRVVPRKVRRKPPTDTQQPTSIKKAAKRPPEDKEVVAKKTTTVKKTKDGGEQDEKHDSPASSGSAGSFIVPKNTKTVNDDRDN